MANLDDDKLDKDMGDDDTIKEEGEDGAEDAEDLDSWELEEEDLD